MQPHEIEFWTFRLLPPITYIIYSACKAVSRARFSSIFSRSPVLSSPHICLYLSNTHTTGPHCGISLAPHNPLLTQRDTQHTGRRRREPAQTRHGRACETTHTDDFKHMLHGSRRRTASKSAEIGRAEACSAPRGGLAGCSFRARLHPTHGPGSMQGAAASLAGRDRGLPP